MTRGKELILMDSNRKITDHIRKIPGPVLDAYVREGGNGLVGVMMARLSVVNY